MIDGLLANKKRMLEEKRRGTHPEALDDEGKADEHKLYTNYRNTKPPKHYIELLILDELENGYYWRALEKLKKLIERKEEIDFGESELRQMTDIMVNQALEGEKIASSVPLYSDVLEYIGGKDICVAKMYARSSMGRNFVD